MSYILEIISINQKENNFLIPNLVARGETEFLQGYQNWWYNELIAPFVAKGYFVDDKISETHDITQNEHGHWLSVKRLGLFKTATMARNLFREYNESTNPYRQKTMLYGREFSLTGEVNILNVNEDISTVAASCQVGVCDRKIGGIQKCPTEGPNACISTVGRNLTANPIKSFHIPLQSFVKFKNK